MNYIQEAVAFEAGRNLVPVTARYRLPSTSSSSFSSSAHKNDVSVLLLSDSFEYDIELIKNMPPPRTDYKNIIIPYKTMGKIGVSSINYTQTTMEYNRKIKYIGTQRLVPNLTIIKPDQIRSSTGCRYIPVSEIVKSLNGQIRNMSPDEARENIFTIFDSLMRLIDPMGKKRLLIIDTKRFRLYQNPSDDTACSDVVNALLSAFSVNTSNVSRKPNISIIFRSPEADYKLDTATFDINRDNSALTNMLRTIGTPFVSSGSNVRDVEVLEDVDDAPIVSEDESTEDDVEVDENIRNIQDANRSDSGSIMASINALKDQYGANQSSTPLDNGTSSSDLYRAKTFDVNTQLLSRINPSNDVVSKYKTISMDLNQNGDADSVEGRIIDDASKKLSTMVEPTDDTSSMNTTTSAREQKIRQQVGRLKLNNITFDTLTSVTDTPLPPAIKPLKLTTTNVGALKGTSFANISKEYENKLLDRDIVATFMNLSKQNNGFYVTNVEVSDVSTIMSLMNNWRVTLKNRDSDRQSVINIRVPKVINGSFYHNGNWYNIGKQDFPIPVLKINKKTVILTTNYNKITVDRYDTKSLVDIGMLTKTLASLTDESGMNRYIKTGSSVNTNSRFESTIEYDEYAKRWYHFINKEADCEIYFNRQQCLKLYPFVTVQDNEFCCGMLNKVPIVVNTETGLTREGKTLTDTMLSTLPVDVQNEYRKVKPGKLSMYSRITVGVVLPLGVAIAAWEGIGSLLKKSGCKYQYVDQKFSDTNYIVIPFKDKSVAIANSTQNQLLFNGFYRINTKSYNLSDFEVPIMNVNSVYVDIFNQMFFSNYSQLTKFITCYNFFVDAITKDVCSHYKIPDDIAGMLIYASNLLCDNTHSSENHASLYRIRTSEIIPAIIHYRLALAVSKFNSGMGSKSRSNSLQFNPNDVINELIAVPNVETRSALNPMVELHARENVTKKGFSGVNDDRTYSLDKRTYEDSMIGKCAMSSPNNSNVGINRQLVIDPKIESVRGYTSVRGADEDYNDLQLASFSELLTPGTVTRDDAIRTAIATSQTSHIVSTADSQPVLISNGVDEIVPSYLSEEFSYTAEDDGKVLEIVDNYMIIQYKSGKKKAINIGNKYSFNTGSGFYVDNKLLTNFEAGQSFQKNDILAYHERFFSKDSDGIIRLNIGPLAKVAFAGIYSTYEDAGLITTKMSKKLATRLTMCQTQKINATDDIEKIVQVGDEVEIDDPLIVFGLGDTGDKSVDNFLKAFQSNSNVNIVDTAKRVIKSKHAGRVVDVRMYTTKSMEKLSPSLFELFDQYFKENIRKRKILDKHDKTDSVYKLDTLYSLPTAPLKGTTIKGITCDVFIEIYIEHEDEASVGDKLVVYGASKQVLSEVVPEGMEPYAESDVNEEISMFVAPSSILKRMIPSLTITASGNKVLLTLKRKVKELWESS